MRARIQGMDAEPRVFLPDGRTRIGGDDRAWIRGAGRRKTGSSPGGVRGRGDGFRGPIATAPAVSTFSISSASRMLSRQDAHSRISTALNGEAPPVQSAGRRQALRCIASPPPRRGRAQPRSLGCRSAAACRAPPTGRPSLTPSSRLQPQNVAPAACVSVRLRGGSEEGLTRSIAGRLRKLPAHARRRRPPSVASLRFGLCPQGF